MFFTFMLLESKKTMCKPSVGNVQTIYSQCANHLKRMCKPFMINVQTISRRRANHQLTSYQQGKMLKNKSYICSSNV
jgi:hypothetical protein